MCILLKLWYLGYITEQSINSKYRFLLLKVSFLCLELQEIKSLSICCIYFIKSSIFELCFMLNIPFFLFQLIIFKILQINLNVSYGNFVNKFLYRSQMLLHYILYYYCFVKCYSLGNILNRK